MLVGLPASRVVEIIVREAGFLRVPAAHVDDVVSEACMRIVRRAPAFVSRPDATAETWIKVQVRYAWLDLLRTRSVERNAATTLGDGGEPCVPGDDFLAPLVREEELAALSDCESKLEEPDRSRWATIRRMRRDGARWEDVAHALGVRADSLKQSILPRIQVLLRRCLSKSGNHPPGGAPRVGRNAR